MEGILATRDGKTVAREFGRGIGPALKLLDAGLLVDTEVRDHIVGRAAAAIFVVGGVVRVHADVMSEGAARFLSEHDLPASADVVTAEIINRQGTGPCPMEAAVAALSEPRQMVEAIRTKLVRRVALTESNGAHMDFKCDTPGFQIAPIVGSRDI